MKQSGKWNQLKLKEPEIGMINICRGPEDGETEGKSDTTQTRNIFLLKLKYAEGL